MAYPKTDHLAPLLEQLTLYTQRQHEYGARGLNDIIKEAGKNLGVALKQVRSLPVDKDMARNEPNGLAAIKKLRPAGPRQLVDRMGKEEYETKLEGALIARMAACTLGAAVEFWPVDKMEKWAAEIGDAFPPTDYWSAVPEPHVLRYEQSRFDEYTRRHINGVPVDDDIVYTLLGLLIMEEYGPDFTVADVGEAWKKYLPLACSAEKVALENLHKGVPAKSCGWKNNPYCEWIGADIRSDPWGYLAPGAPEKAAELAYRDAYISHRRNGIYGEMYFAAVIAAAFAVDDPVKALKIGLTEIPKNCAMARTVRWALKKAPEIRDYRQARAAMDAKFKGMHRVHTLNNACLTIWGLTIGGTDFTKVASEIVAMGMDNDCTAATAGSIVGAIVGKKGIEKHWYKNFNNTVHSYLIGKKKFTISGLVKRFQKSRIA